MNLYKILEINNNASFSEIKKSYYKLCRKYHPDRNDNITDNLFKNISYAYQIISDSKKRLKYDNYLKNKKNSNKGNNENFMNIESSYQIEINNINSLKKNILNNFDNLIEYLIKNDKININDIENIFNFFDNLPYFFKNSLLNIKDKYLEKLYYKKKIYNIDVCISEIYNNKIKNIIIKRKKLCPKCINLDIKRNLICPKCLKIFKENKICKNCNVNLTKILCKFCNSTKYINENKNICVNLWHDKYINKEYDDIIIKINALSYNNFYKLNNKDIKKIIHIDLKEYLFKENILINHLDNEELKINIKDFDISKPYIIKNKGILDEKTNERGDLYIYIYIKKINIKDNEKKLLENIL